MKRLRFWNEIDSIKFGVEDEYGILAYCGHYPSAQDMSQYFTGTDAAVWGNIIKKGRGASGSYGEIISLIKRLGFEKAVQRWSYGDREYNDNTFGYHKKSLLSGLAR